MKAAKEENKKEVKKRDIFSILTLFRLGFRTATL